MPKKAFSLPEHVLEQFDQLFLQSSAHRPEITQGAFFEELLLRYNASSNLISELKDQLVTLRASQSETETETLANLHQTTDKLEETQHNLQVILSKLDASEIETALTNLESLQQLAQKPAQRIEIPVEKSFVEGEIRLIVPENPTRKLLIETCHRLSKLYGREVAPADLLLDIFIRYTVEQYNQWMFPFVIQPHEFHALTGYNQTQLKAWLNSLKTTTDE